MKLTRSLPSGSQFVSYIDAIGELDGTKCIIDWKTTTCRYPDQPQGLLALDPQLICYSWMTGISDVALVVFVRKNAPEIQYLKTRLMNNSAGNLASWLRPQPTRLKRANSFRTAEFVSPRTVV